MLALLAITFAGPAAGWPVTAPAAEVGAVRVAEDRGLVRQWRPGPAPATDVAEVLSLYALATHKMPVPLLGRKPAGCVGVLSPTPGRCPLIACRPHGTDPPPVDEQYGGAHGRKPQGE